MNSLLGNMQAPAGQGLLNQSAQPMQAAPQQGGTDPKQLAMMLAQSPTPDTVQKIISQIQGNPSQDSEKWVQVLAHYANDPKTLSMISQEVLKNAGGNAG